MFPLIESVFLQSIIVLAAVLILLRFFIAIAAYWRASTSRQSHIVDQINQLLPQTQCGRCGYLGCLPYAKAISQGEKINKCPPGGEWTIAELSILLNETKKSLDPAHGKLLVASVAVIREDECIGCTKCIQACPVDAILGGPKLMHSVLSKECTACDLCIEPCPVDCIDLIEIQPPETLWGQPLAQHSSTLSLQL